MAELDHLSYSSVSAFCNCPHSWRLKYVEKIPTLPTPALVFGSAFHAAAEGYLAERAAGVEPDTMAIWTEAWAKAIEQEINWSSELPEALSNQGLQMLSNKECRATLDGLSLMVVETGTPVIEKRIELRVPGVPVPVIGFIDLICGDGVPADIKTAARSWTQDKADMELQPAYYLAALAQAGYRQNPDMAFTYIVFTKTKTPKVDVIRTRRTGANLLWLFWAVRQVWAGIAVGSFPPNPGSWLCTPGLCSYWSICRGRR